MSLHHSSVGLCHSNLNISVNIVIGSIFVELQRDVIQAASSFAQRNQLPVHLQDQMLSHLCLRHRTDSEGLQQQETNDVLPKAIRSSISHFLFYSLVDTVYLFRGVSNNLLFQLVITSTSSSSVVLFGWSLLFNESSLSAKGVIITVVCFCSCYSSHKNNKSIYTLF